VTRDLAAFWRDGGGPFRRPPHPLRDGVTVVLHPSTATVGHLLRRGEPGIAGRVVDSLTADGSTSPDEWTFTAITGRMIGE
jgi:hypothetical protein